MKVAFVLREDYDTNPGGDVVQLQNTANELKLIGVDVSFITSIEQDNRDFDFYHIFNLTRVYEAYKWQQYLSKNDKRYVLSPIWHSLVQMKKFYGLGLGVLFPITFYLGLKDAVLAKDLDFWSRIQLFMNWKGCVKKCVTNAKLLLPNSDQEAETLFKEIDLDIPVNYFVVPNAVSLKEKYDVVKKAKVIVCAARIEPRKNQVRIIEAFKKLLKTNAGSNSRLVFVGSVNEKHPVYAKKFMAKVESTENVEFFGKVGYSEVQEKFANSKVAILASHFETTGLVALEAQYQGANVVMTECSYNDYYFGDTVKYCDPRNIDSIYKALLSALKEEKATSRECDFDKFSWKHVAKQTLIGYQSV